MEDQKHPLQIFFDSLSKGWRAERALSQMTLGRLIEKLESTSEDAQIVKLTNPHSYRGYYSDLSFELGEGTQTVKEFLNVLKSDCLGETFTGYKGGDFYMDKHTPLWIASWGDTGVKIMEINGGDVLSFITEEDSH